jgi:hypothetical protein
VFAASYTVRTAATIGPAAKDHESTLETIYYILGANLDMTIINVMALAVCTLLYASVYGQTWQDRYSARLTLGSSLLLVLAITI